MKKIFTLALAMMATMGAMADQLTPAQALARMNGNASAAKGAASSMTLAYTAKADGLNTYYAFNKANGGFVLVSADDCMPAVLGDVDGASFNYDNLPANAKWYIDLLSEEVAYKAKNGMVTADDEHISRDAIPYLLAHRYGAESIDFDIRFDQDTPYNTLSPTYCYEAENTKEGRPAGTSIHCATGCVATAMAQIMTYWMWPSKGTGSLSYTWKLELTKGVYDTTEQTSSSDFSSHTYDWNNILAHYVKIESPKANNPVDGITQANKDAIAQLLFDCGVAAKMGWGTNTSGGSGASGTTAAAGMMKFFDYSKSMNSITKSDFTQLVFEDTIYNELKNKRPILCLGGGHAFVCDGFQDGKFHFNWGWEGANDVSGYFYMTETGMVPEVSGSGGAGEGATYHTNLYTVIGLQPSFLDNSNYKAGNLIQEANDLVATTSTSSSAKGANVTEESAQSVISLTCKDGFKLASEAAGQELDLGVMFVDLDENGEETDSCWISDDVDGRGSAFKSGVEVVKSIDVNIISDLEPGKSYAVVPIYWPSISDEDIEKQDPEVETDEEADEVYWDLVWINNKAIAIPANAKYPTITIPGKTAINSVKAATTKSNAVRKSLKGSRIVIVKDGKQFNAAGQQM